MISLQAVDTEFSGIGTDWPTVANALQNHGLLNRQHAFDISVLRYFGRLIKDAKFLPQKNIGNVRLIAMDFWESIATDDRISEDLRNYLAKGDPVS